MSLEDLLGQLPLPLHGDDAALSALVVGMVLEDECGIVLDDAELHPERIGDLEGVLHVLRAHGVVV